jgi:hypothetical protein
MTPSRRDAIVIGLFYWSLSGRSYSLETKINVKEVSPIEQSPSYLKFAFEQPRLIGQAKYTYWGFDVYQARLWSETPLLIDSWQQNRFALELIYLRDFEGKSIAKRSLDEISKQKDIEAPKAREWLNALEGLFPNVKKNQSITGVYIPNYGAKFFHMNNLIGEIKDLELTKSFFDIWFSSKTSSPELRKELLKDPS